MVRNIAMSMFILLLITANITIAQTWDKQQKEVWSNIETYHEIKVKGDLEGILGYFHKDFSGWPANEPVPHNKEARAKMHRHHVTKVKFLYYYLTPLAIKVHGDVAVVHYVYTYQLVNKSGKENTAKGRATDVLLKQGNKWVFVADAGISLPKD